jgi:holo-[acyl-carrier protein] synthase
VEVSHRINFMKVIGVDMIETERVAQAVSRFGERYLKRVYTARELAYCQGRIPSLAARWAAKEAVSKALGTGIGDVSWQEIEVINQSNCQPTLHLHGAAAALASQLGLSYFAISLSHTKAHAIAFVVGE